MRLSLIWGVLSAVMAATPAYASSIDDPICADRPGFGSATCTVPKGHWQVETALADWTLEKVDGDRSTELDFGASAIKYGVTDHFHVEIDVVPLVRTTSRSVAGNDRHSGFGDVVLAAKQELGGSGPLSAAIYPYVKLPTAGHDLGNGKVEGGVRVPLGLALGSSLFSLSSTPEIDLVADADGHGRHVAMSHVVGFGWAAGDALSFAAEAWGQWDWDPAGATRAVGVSGSGAYRVGKAMQLDAGAVLGLNRAAPDVRLYVGVSNRF